LVSDAACPKETKSGDLFKFSGGKPSSRRLGSDNNTRGGGIEKRPEARAGKREKERDVDAITRWPVEGRRGEKRGQHKKCEQEGKKNLRKAQRRNLKAARRKQREGTEKGTSAL